MLNYNKGAYLSLSYRLVFLFISAISFTFLISMVSHQPPPFVENQSALQPEESLTKDTLPSKILKTPLAPPQAKARLYYGIAMDTHGVKTGVVQPGQTLAHLLNPHGIPKAVIFQAAKKSKPVFDVRRIKAGNTYSLIYTPGDDDRIRYFIYDKTPTNYVVFAFDNPIQVYAGKKEIEIKIRTFSGTITSNLWNAARDSGMSQDLIYALGDIFSSTMDFRHLHKGDRFMITFEEQFVQNKCVGIGKINAAQLTCCDQTFQAFGYEVNGLVSYYDEKGNSLEKSFLKSPLKYSRISSKFTTRRLHPIKQKYLPHPGIDYAAPRGTPVKSVGDGTVIFMGYSKSAGTYIKIKHSSVGTSEYMHLSKFHARIKKNQTVKKGQIIGYVGSTGYATGPHLDLRFKKNGRYVDYSKMNLPTGKSLAKPHKEIFLKQVATIKQQWEDAPRLSLNLPAKEPDVTSNTQKITTTTK
jgi:murein DD-endopeptidase MepM/ murein hydrolase activator NlpD